MTLVRATDPLRKICAASGAASGRPHAAARDLRHPRASLGTGRTAGLQPVYFCPSWSAALAAADGPACAAIGGFVAGPANDESALHALTLIYAGLPCVLKTAAIVALALPTTKRDPNPGHRPVTPLLLPFRCVSSVAGASFATASRRSGRRPRRIRSARVRQSICATIFRPDACDGVIFGPTGRVTSRSSHGCREPGPANVDLVRGLHYDSGTTQHRAWTLALGMPGISPQPRPMWSAPAPAAPKAGRDAALPASADARRWRSRP